MSESGLDQAQRKMRDGGVHDTAIDVFTHFYRALEAGETGIIAEAGSGRISSSVGSI